MQPIHWQEEADHSLFQAI